VVSAGVALLSALLILFLKPRPASAESTL